jgi:Glycosyltransferase family 10 (fucosyltransferase) C-term
VPVILGAQNSEQLMPPNSAIFASNFNSWDKMTDYVKQVSENKTLWESFHAWRVDEKALATYEARFNFTKTSPECRTCRWAYAKRYGLGWNHRQQSIQDTRLHRRLCLTNDKKLVTQPFRESWIHRGTQLATSVAAESCSTLMSEASVEVNGYAVDRSVVQHDGVVDITIRNIQRENDSQEVTLRFYVNVRNSEGAFFRDSHTLVPTMRGSLASSATIQDEYAKVTVLADWETAIRSNEEGSIDIPILRNGESWGTEETRRIRVIVEDMNPLHDKMTEFFPSSYGTIMTQDFVDPVELFFAA